MTWVKICGITNIEDARTAAEAGADALGFVFYERSRRKVGAGKVREILGGLGSRIEAVGVFVGGSCEEVLAVAREAGLQAIQWHRSPLAPSSAGQEREQVPVTQEDCFRNMKLYFSMPVEEVQTMTWGTTLPSAVFIDSSTAQEPGGTGRTFDWAQSAQLIEQMSRKVKVIVAGGLNPDNVASAIALLRPWGVDVSSGVEAQPGKKDPEKVWAFVKAVREADRTA